MIYTDILLLKGIERIGLYGVWKSVFFIVCLIVISGCYRPKIIIPARHDTVEKTLLDTCNSIECLTEVIKINPKDVQAHWWLGTKLQARQDYPAAIKELTIAIELDSSYNLGFPYRDRANCKNNLGDNSGAVLDMNAAIRHNPDERYFYCDRGTYLSNLQKYELALKDFDTALRIWDKYFEARVWKAKTLVELENYKEAMAEYEILDFTIEFMNNPSNTYDIYYRGLARFNSNDKDGACKDWTVIANRYEEARKLFESNCK